MPVWVPEGKLYKSDTYAKGTRHKGTLSAGIYAVLMGLFAPRLEVFKAANAGRVVETGRPAETIDAFAIDSIPVTRYFSDTSSPSDLPQGPGGVIFSGSSGWFFKNKAIGGSYEKNIRSSCLLCFDHSSKRW